MKNGTTPVLVNCTGHYVDLLLPDGGNVRLEPSGHVARVSSTRTKLFDFPLKGGTFPVYRVRYGVLEGLPPPRPDTLYVVSKMAAIRAAAEGRRDVVMVDDVGKDGANRFGAQCLGQIDDGLD